MISAECAKRTGGSGPLDSQQKDGDKLTRNRSSRLLRRLGEFLPGVRIAIVDAGRRAERLEIVVVLRTGGRKGVDAGELGELEHAATDGAGGAPDEQAGANGARGGGRAGLAEPDDERRECGGQTHRQHGGVDEGQSVRQPGRCGLLDERVRLPGAAVGVAAHHDGAEAQHAVARSDARDIGPHRSDLAGHVGAEHGGQLGDDEAVALHLPVDGVAGDRAIADEHLVVRRGGDGPFLDPDGDAALVGDSGEVAFGFGRHDGRRTISCGRKKNRLAVRRGLEDVEERGTQTELI